MEVAKIIYYTRVDGKSKTVSLKELNLREDFYLEDVFYAVKEAADIYDLTFRLKRILHDQIELDTEDPDNPRFTITDVRGNVNYLKLKPKKENNDGT